MLQIQQFFDDPAWGLGLLVGGAIATINAVLLSWLLRRAPSERPALPTNPSKPSDVLPYLLDALKNTDQWKILGSGDLQHIPSRIILGSRTEIGFFGTYKVFHLYHPGSTTTLVEFGERADKKIARLVRDLKAAHYVRLFKDGQPLANG